MGAVLSIDTAGPVVGAALWTPEAARCWSARVVRGADGLLLPAIDALINGLPDTAEGQWQGPLLREELDLVVVSVGPGAFTGLRVGVSAALGVAMARQVPVVALSSLEARAAQVDGDAVLALLDAKKSRVYSGLYRVSGGVPAAIGPEQDVAPELAMPAHPFVATGEGALVFRGIVEAAGGQVAPDPDLVPVLALARLAWARRAEAIDPGDVALRYLRPPDAQPPGDLPAPQGAIHATRR